MSELWDPGIGNFWVLALMLGVRATLYSMCRKGKENKGKLRKRKEKENEGKGRSHLAAGLWEVNSPFH